MLQRYRELHCEIKESFGNDFRSDILTEHKLDEIDSFIDFLKPLSTMTEVRNNLQYIYILYICNTYTMYIINIMYIYIM